MQNPMNTLASAALTATGAAALITLSLLNLIPHHIFEPTWWPNFITWPSDMGPSYGVACAIAATALTAMTGLLAMKLAQPQLEELVTAATLAIAPFTFGPLLLILAGVI